MRALHLVAACVLPLLLASCSAIVRTEDVPLYCDPLVSNPCPTGLRCSDGVCVPRATMDGGDRDGGNDAGCIFSTTHDGCNGRDDDCDGRIDEGSPPTIGACTTGFTCFREECRDARDCQLPGNECTAGTFCDTGLVPPSCAEDPCEPPCGLHQECVRADPRECRGMLEYGETCSADGECAEGFCASPTALRLGAILTAGFCSRACCEDSDCPGTPGSYCHASGSGARACVPRQKVGVAGGTEPGGHCTGFRECSTGLCSATEIGGGGGECASNCASNEDCGGDPCVLHSGIDRDPRVELRATYCGGASSGAAFGEACTVDADCASGICLNVDGVGNRCSKPCSQSSVCAFSMPGVTVHTRCGYVSRAAGGGDGPTADRIQACLGRVGSTPGSLPNGATCTDNLQCRDQLCVHERCEGVCCKDAQCGAGRCRPVRITDEEWEMRCSVPLAPPT